MAIRREKDGNLIFFYGASQLPEEPEQKVNPQVVTAAVLLAAGTVLAGVWYIAPHPLDWPTVTHTIKSFLSVIW